MVTVESTQFDDLKAALCRCVATMRDGRGLAVGIPAALDSDEMLSLVALCAVQMASGQHVVLPKSFTYIGALPENVIATDFGLETYSDVAA